MLEVGEPAFEQRVEIANDTREALPACSWRLRPDAVLEAVQTLLAHKPPSGFEPVAEELKPFPVLPAVADMGFARMQTQAVRRYPGADFRPR